LALQRGLVEGVLVGHVQLEPLRRLAGVADGPHAAVELAGDVFDVRLVAFDRDVLEHLGRQAELLREQYMISWSGFDSNSGSITFSRHWSERLDAVTEP
jgi:hypothetical protein